MKRQPVISSSLAAIGYDSTSQLLEVQFRNGNVYQYLGVTPRTYKDLLTADSLGAFVNHRIKGRHDFRRLE